MKIVMTIAAWDAQFLDAQLAFHLNAGVDLVLATGDEPDDEVSEILDAYARLGHLVRGTVEGGRSALEQQALVARLAATELAADWVIAAAPNEFWWPRGASLKDVLVAVPPRYGVVQALVRHLRPRPGTSFFAERMVVRQSLATMSAGSEPLLHLLRPIQRVAPGVGVDSGQVLRAWYPVEVFHFPVDPPLDGDVAPADEAATRGLEDGSLVLDERLRDALHALRDGSGYQLPVDGRSRLTFPIPTVVDDAAHAVECAAVGEVDLDRLDRHIRGLEDRIAWLEQRFWPRVLRTLSRVVRPSGS